MAAGDPIEPDHTFLFFLRAPGGGREGRQTTFRTWPFVHAGGYIAARKRLVDLSLYEANENYFPFYYRPALNPFLHLAPDPLGIEGRPPGSISSAIRGGRGERGLRPPLGIAGRAPRAIPRCGRWWPSSPRPTTSSTERGMGGCCLYKRHPPI